MIGAVHLPGPQLAVCPTVGRNVTLQVTTCCYEQRLAELALGPVRALVVYESVCLSPMMPSRSPYRACTRQCNTVTSQDPPEERPPAARRGDHES
jgi:hypothetical protein